MRRCRTPIHTCSVCKNRYYRRVTIKGLKCCPVCANPQTKIQQVMEEIKNKKK